MRVLLLADTHIGLDLPLHPRTPRRRRGDDFLANFWAATALALRGDVDVVVHGGDLLDRGRLPNAIVERALAPLTQVANAGIPVYLVPGNHERSRIPLSLWTVHPNLHIFRQPATFVHTVGRTRLAISGFPAVRGIRSSFGATLQATGWQAETADIRLLCMHQAIEGSQVGVQNYTFRDGGDVLPTRDLPGGFAAVFSGHIHRHQVLRQDLRGRRLATPVVYPGSVERTAFAEREETKGYVIAELLPGAAEGGILSRVQFVPLPVRPMVVLTWVASSMGPTDLRTWLASTLAGLDADAVVSLRPHGVVPDEIWSVLRAHELQALTPAGMNVELSLASAVGPTRRSGKTSRTRFSSDSAL